MKKSFAIFFAFLLLFQSFGLLWWFKMEQITLHYEMQEKAIRTDFDLLIELNLPLSKYFASIKDEGKEIELEGKMYDIKSVKITNGRVKIYALRDTKEENLLRCFSQFLEHSNSDQKQIPDSFSKIVSLSFITPFTEPMCLLFECFIPFGLKKDFALVTYQNSLDTPPPKLNDQF
jgi:hypothetical protein